MSARLIKQLFILALVASMMLPSLARPVRASTSVGGVISVNTTWALSGSPYIVTDNITVLSGVTLTIDPGVVVKFESGKSLTIEGELLARGTSTNQITFTSNQATPAAGDWANILFTTTSVPATFDSNGDYVSGSILQHVVLEYAGLGVPGAVTLSGAAPYIDQSWIQHTSASGLYVDSASQDVRITQNDISDSAPAHWRPAIYLAGSATISDNAISGGSFSGIFVDSGGNATISRNRIFGISIGSSPVFIGGGITVRQNATARIESNTITGNSVTSDPCCAWTAGGIMVASQSVIVGNTISNNYAFSQATGVGSGISVFASDTVVSNNLITGNSGSSAIFFRGASNVNISDNQITNNPTVGIYAWSNDGTITRNIIAGNMWGVLPDLGGCCGLQSLTVSDNLISENNIGIRMVGGYGSTATINIYGNRIEDNREGGLFLTHASATCNTVINNGSQAAGGGFGAFFEGPPPPDFSRNTLLGNAPYDAVNGQGATIPAANNWWGTVDTAQIDAHIYDYFDDATKGVVTYTPFLPSADQCAPSDTPPNQLPTADADNKSTNEDTTLTFPTSDLLANDSAGPPEENGQTLTVTAVSARETTHGAVSLNGGNITYTPAADFNGSASFEYTVCDDGSPIECATGTVNITVDPVNDAPSFAKGTDPVTVLEDSEAYSAGWATAISVGPANEASQALTFKVTNDNNSLFAMQPAVDVAGKLTFTSAPNANGSATLRVLLRDNGGTVNGGVDTSPPQSLIITVIPVNDVPVANPDSRSTRRNRSVTIAVLANDSDVEQDPLIVTAVTQPTNGSVVINPDSTITYAPRRGYVGPDFFTYTISDGNAGTTTARVDVTVTPR